MAAPEELDLDPIEPVEDPKPAKKGTGSKPKLDPPEEREPEPKAKANKGKKGDKADGDEAPERQPRKSVAGDRKVPYPPSPENVPEGLTEFPESFKKQQKLLLAGLVLFLTLYIGALLFCALIGVWCVWSFWHWMPLKVVCLFFTSLTFLFLVKAFFKRPQIDRDTSVEITEEEHPVLFEFIYRLCEEVGAPEPNKVFVSADVNAMCISHTSLFSLFIEPKKDVLIGLGLVNAVNLSEFKAILAHEFGHFSHLGKTSNYVHIMQRVILDMIRGEDLLDRLVVACKRKESLRWLGYLIGGPLWMGRMILIQVFKLIALQNMAVSREQEFHADLVAVSAAGSNAATHGLLRARFAMQCFTQALRDLVPAMDHKLYSNDMYLHQSRAAAVVRRLKKEPELGLPPVIASPSDGEKIRVFDAEQDELEDQDETPPMWRSHPSDADREENAKEQFVAATLDHRSPWILFDDLADLKERLTYKFYRSFFRIPKNTELSDAVKVQKFIDNEHADTTYDPKYKGAYDERTLEPGDLSELNALIRDTPWTEERMEKVLDKLYDGCVEHAEAHSELYKELETLTGGIVGRPSKTMKRKIEEVEQRQEANREWFKSFDRRVYLLHVQMAAQVDKELKNELVERYRFQLEVQRFYFASRQAFNKADAYFSAYIAAAQGKIQVSPDFGGEVMQVLRESWKTLKNIIKDAREISLPAMKNFEEGDNLADFILEGKMVPEPPLSYVKGVWINKLMTQLQGVRLKCFRLHFKSVGGILRLHEQISAKWKALREPVAAEVLDMEPVAAEVIGEEIVAAEVLPDEPIAAEVIAAEVIPAEPAAPPLPAPPTHAAMPEPPKATAAFMASSAPVATPELRSPTPPVPEAAAPVPPPAPAAPPMPAPVVAKPEPEPVVPEPVATIASLPSADPFDFIPAPPRSSPPKSAVVKAPEPPAAAAPVAPAPFPAVAAAPVVSEVFALDDEPVAEEPAEPAPKPALAPPTPATAPAASASAPVAAEEIFSLDAEEVPAKPAEPAKSVEVAFSLDADDHKPAPPAPVAKAPEPAPKPASAVIPVPAVAPVAAAPVPVPAKPASGVIPAVASAPSGSAAVPAPASRTAPVAPPSPPPAPASKPALSGVVEVPAAKSAFGSGSKPGTKRPPIKITVVKPGEKSPLAK